MALGEGKWLVLRLAGELRGHPHTELKLRVQASSPLGWWHTIPTLGIPGTRRSWNCSSMLDFWGVPEVDDNEWRLFGGWQLRYAHAQVG